jgi:uncharacterized membrane protein YhiD involved in acid resistance
VNERTLNVDANDILKWGLSFLGLIALAVVAHMNSRFSRLEDWVKKSMDNMQETNRASANGHADRLRTAEESAKAHAAKGDHELWEALTRHAKETQEFREAIIRDGVTKADLANFKADLKDHITVSISAAVATIKNSK